MTHIHDMIWRSAGLLILLMSLTSSSFAAEPAVIDPPVVMAQSPAPTVFMKNSGWCWFQDPRAIIHNDKLVVGGVEGNGDGAAVIGVYDLKARRILGRTIVHPKFDRDDHNSPVFHALPDGRLLTVYARHHRDRLHLFRHSTSEDLLKWGPQQTFKHDYRNAGNVTYMNLYAMRDEGKLYNFFRGIAFNPSFITSTDGGKTWGEPTHFIQNEVGGRQRPYARYAGNGKDTVHVSFTDAHPRQFGNSIYYAAFSNGKFFKADGSLIKSLKDGGALRPSEADKVFAGGGGPGRGGNRSAARAAWTSSIEIDANGYPHIGYMLHLENDDQRYRIASWNGKRWIDRQVAHAGNCLYPREASYTGLIALGPIDPTFVVISTDVHPSTGKPLGRPHQVFRANIKPTDDVKTIQWQALTKDKVARNIRPMVLRNGNQRITLWQRGRFNTFTNYELDTVGVVETVK